MHTQHLFCPSCDKLIIGADRCDKCGWGAPKPGGGGDALWEAKLGVRLPRKHSTPACIDEVICAPTADNHLVAFSAKTHKRLWHKPVLPAQTHALGVTAYDGLFYCAPESTDPLGNPSVEVIAISPQDGEVAWRYAIPAQSLGVPVVHAGVLYVAASGGALWAIDLHVKEPVWNKPVTLPGWSPDAPALSGDGALIAPTRKPRIAAINIADGTQRWQFDSPTGDWFPLTSACSSDAVFIPCWNNMLYAVELSNGAPRWPARIERGITCSPVVIDDRVVIGAKVGAKDKTSWAHALLFLDPRTGEVVKRIETAHNPDVAHVNNPPGVNSNTIVIGTEHNRDGISRVIALDRTTLDERWRAQVEANIVCSPIFVNEAVIILTEDGKIYAFRHSAQLDQVLLSPVEHVDRGEYAQAALAFALQGDVMMAAHIYEENLSDPQHAIKLYQRAGAPEKVSRLYELIGDIESAAASLQVPTAQAEFWSRHGQHLRAAEIYQQHDDKLNAAREYEAGGKFGTAAILYTSLKLYDDAIRCNTSAGDDVAVAELLRAQERYPDAAEAFKRLKRWADAALMYRQVKDHANAGLCYEQAGQFTEAADEYEQAHEYLKTIENLEKSQAPENRDLYVRHYQRIAALSQQILPPDHLRTALAYAKMAAKYDNRKKPGDKPPFSKQYLSYRGSEAQYWFTHAHALETQDSGNCCEQAAEAYEKASQAYQDVMLKLGIEKSEDRLAFHLQLPVLHLNAKGSFVEGGSEVLEITVTNRGYGPAGRLRLSEVEKPLIYDPIKDFGIDRLDPDENDALRVSLKVSPGEYGRRLIRIYLEYEAFDEKPHKVPTPWFEILIRRKDEPSGGIQNIYNGPVYNTTGKQNIATGDQVNIDHATDAAARIRSNSNDSQQSTPG